MANLRLYFETESKLLSLSPTGPLGFNLPPFRQEDTIGLEISLIRQTSAAIPAFELLTISGYSIRATVGTVINGTATAIVSTTAFTASSDAKSVTGELNLNVAGITALADKSDIFFELIATLNTTVYGRRFQTTIEKGIFTSGSLVAPPGDTALGLSEALRKFVLLDGTSSFVMRSVPGNIPMLIQVSDDGAWTASPIT